METVVAWTRDSEQFLIEEIRDRRCLWDHKSPNYMKKGLKRKNYQEITMKLRENFAELAGLHADQVRTKLNNLKAYFNREYKKVQAAPSGSGGKPSSRWELFDVMSFLKDTLDPQPTYSSEINSRDNHVDTPVVIEVDTNPFEDSEGFEDLLYLEESSHFIEHGVTSGSSSTSTSPAPTTRTLPPTPKSSSSVAGQKPRSNSKRKLQKSFEEDVLQTLRDLGTSSDSSPPEDLCTVTGKTVTLLLRTLSKKGQRIASLKIQQLLMEMEEEYGLADD